jgi:Transposase
LGPPLPLLELEATGGRERLVVTALALAGLPVAVVNPRQVRAFAQASGRLAKTAALDAAALAHCSCWILTLVANSNLRVANRGILVLF